MTERWERELKKLRQAEPTDDVWARAQRGPSGGDPLPPRRQRVVAGVVAMGVFLAAGAFGWNALREHPGSGPAGAASTATIRYTLPGPAEPVIARLNVQDATTAAPGPWMHLSYGGREQDVPAQELANWSGPSQGTNAILYGFSAKIPLGSTLRFEGDATTVTAEIQNDWHGGDHVYVPLPITDGSADLPGPGSFVLRVVGSWDAGTAGFTVRIDVYDDIHLDNGSRPPSATMSFGDPRSGDIVMFPTAEAVVTSYEWKGLWYLADHSGKGDRWPPAVDSFAQVPQGTQVTVEGPDVGGAPQLALWDPSFEHKVWGPSSDWASEPPFTVAPGRYVLVLEITSADRRPSTILRYAFGVEVIASDVSPSPTLASEIPDVLHVTCTPTSATLDTTQVRPQSDGLHVVMDASGDVANAEIDTGSTPETFSGVGVDPHDDGSRGIPIAPGPWFVGCSARGDAVPIDAFGTARAPAFTIVDPEGIYVPVDLACHAPTTRTYGVTGSDITHDSIAAVPGILSTDTVQPAGYPDGPGFKDGPILTVLRDGSAVARIHLPFEANGSWTVSVDACPGSGIGPDAPAGATAPVPDLAVVRCVGDVTQVQTPIVNAHADGLHLRVENEAGSAAIVVSSAWDRTHPYRLPIPTDPNEEIVVPAHPGPVVIDCVSSIGGGIDDPFLSHSADDLHLQDPSGLFVPDGLDCDNSDQVPIVTPKTMLLPAGEAAIRANLSGINDGDVVERAGYLEGRGDDGPWRIVRDGQIIARVDYPSLEGLTCKGAGITGA
jgi:hypothetical protein